MNTKLGILTVMIVLLMCGVASATTYYINGTSGNNAWEGNFTHPWATISKANTDLVAGDTVYIRGGTYSSEQIKPSNSGTSGNYITYQNYSTEIVTIDGGSGDQADLTGKSYTVIDGVRFNNSASEWIFLEGSTYNIIQNCYFYDSAAYGGLRLNVGSNYNKILNNVFPDAPINPTNDGTLPVDLVRPVNVKYNVFEGNTFGDVSHQALDIEGTGSMYNVVRNNFFQNKYHTGASVYAHPSWHLIENNTFYDQGDDYLNDPTPASQRLVNPGIQLGGSNCIVRNNVADNCGSGLFMVPDPGYTCIDNRIYHNTFNNNLRNYYTGAQPDTVFNHVFKNNILTNGQAHSDIIKTEVGYDVYYGYNDVGASIWRNNTVYGGPMNRYRYAADNNESFLVLQAIYPAEIFNSTEVDPLYTNNATRDFTLQSGSPCIDAGDWLTTITSSTNTGQTIIVVDDASYFYDGWSIPGEVGDTIKTEGGKETIITSINYGTDTLTVSPAIDIVNAEGLALTYNGDAPDIGAYEYVSGTTAPNITSWANNDTNDDTLSITVDANQQVNFNATANQTITTWTWKKDVVGQSHNYDNITLNWSSLGSKSVTVTAANANGASSAVEWVVTVEQTGTWNYYKEILINHSMVYEDLINFSVLVNFTDSDLFDHAQTDGDDIIFRASDKTTQLDHEQEYWNKTTGDYVGWVRVPAITGAINTTIYMYYNNSDAINSENPAGVWDDNYKAVYHMPETPPGTIHDSTSNDNDGTTSGMDSADQVTGQIDGALDMDGIDDYFHAGVDTSLDCGNDLTITVYAERDGTLLSADMALCTYRIGTSQAQYTLFYNSDERIQFWLYDGAWRGFTGTAQVQNTNPHRIDFTRNGTYAWTYIDGVQDNSGAFAYTANNGNEVLWIGDDSDTAGRNFDGVLDEVRISDTPRSAGWISTGYNNTKYPALFISVGAEQSDGGADTKFEYWDSTAWVEDSAEYYLWFECFWITSGYPDGVAPNAEQTNTQYTLRITNNGTAAGTPKMKFNESTPAEVTVYVDDDHTVAGAVSITNTYQAVAPSLSAGENVTLSAWVNLTGLTSTWEYEVYATVE